MNAFPLLLAYLAPPLAEMAGASSSAVAGRLDWAWAALAAAAAVWSAGRRPSGKGGTLRALAVAALLACLGLAGLMVLKPLLLAGLGPISLLPELSPAAYVGFGVLWAWTFPSLDSRAFMAAGAILGGVLAADMAQASLAAGQFVRPLGPFGAEAEASLLLVSLCFAMRSPADLRKYGLIILLGIAASMSRPCMLCAAALIGLLAPGSASRRALAVLGLVAVLFLAGWAVRSPEASLLRLDWYWTWAAGVEALVSHPEALIHGFPLGEAVPLTFKPPELLLSLWEQLLPGSPVLPGVPSTFGPFWLRLVMCWGVGPVALFLFGYPVLLGRRPTRPLAGLFVVILVCGTVSALVYQPAMGAVAGLALVAGAREGRAMLQQDDAPEEV